MLDSPKCPCDFCALGWNVYGNRTCDANCEYVKLKPSSVRMARMAYPEAIRNFPDSLDDSTRSADTSKSST